MSSSIYMKYGRPHIFNIKRGGSPYIAQAVAHYDRVIADSGIAPKGIVGVNDLFTSVLAIYGETDITTSLAAMYDAHYLGFKMGAGSGLTAGRAASKLYSACGADGDIVQNTASNQPLALVHEEGKNYWFSPAVVNNWCRALDITNPTNSGWEVDIKLSITSYDIDTVNFAWWFSHDNGGTRPIFVGPANDRYIRVFWNNFTYSATSTAQFPAGDFDGWFRTRIETVGSDMVVSFYTSLDGTTWTILGTNITVVGAANTAMTNTVPFHVMSNSGANVQSGKVYRIIYKDATGTPILDFNPNDYNAATSQSGWESSTTGETWEIFTDTSTTTHKGTLVDRSQIQFKGTAAVGGLGGSSETVTDFVENDYCIALVGLRYTNTNDDFPYLIGSDYAENNATGLYLDSGPSLLVFNKKTGSLFIKALDNTDTVKNLFVFSTKVVYDGTSKLLLNGTNTDTTIFTTAQKPTPSGFFGIANSFSYSNLNGLVNTLVFAKDNSKHVEIADYIKTLSNI